MESDNKILSIIIVSYNCLDILKDCIESVWKYNDLGDALEVIVVDNSSDGDTIEWLTNECKSVIAIKNDNKGFGQANNVGAKVAKGKYLLFLNPDTLLVEPVGKYAIDKFNRYPNIGCFGVQLIGKNGKRTHSTGFRMNMGFFRTLSCVILTQLGIFVQRIMFTTGADIFIAKDVFIEAGMFDENLFMYCEEADLSNRLNSMDKKVYFFKDMKIIHLEGKTSDSRLSVVYEREAKSKEYYCKKYGLSFAKEGMKERKYCNFKRILFGLLGNKTLASEYKKIVNMWDEKLK